MKPGVVCGQCSFSVLDVVSYPCSNFFTSLIAQRDTVLSLSGHNNITNYNVQKEIVRLQAKYTSNGQIIITIL